MYYLLWTLHDYKEDCEVFLAWLKVRNYFLYLDSYVLVKAKFVLTPFKMNDICLESTDALARIDGSISLFTD